MEEKLHTRSDGRVVAYFDYGQGDNVIFFHHATQVAGPLSPLLIKEADLHHFRVIEVVRSGYGNSTSAPNRDIWQVAPINLEFADHLGISTFGIIGYAGGGPHALASMKIAGDRCVGAVIVAGLAPFAEADFDFYEGMDDANKQEWQLSRENPEQFEVELTQYADEWGGFDFEKLKSVFNSGPGTPMPEDWLRAFYACVKYSLQQGANGLREDSFAFINPWGFSPSEIAAPLQMWAGTKDVNAPAGHARWLHQNIPGSELHILDEKDHNSVVEPAWEAGFAWLQEIFDRRLT